MIIKTLQFCELRREVINEREKKQRNGEESFGDHQGTGSIIQKQCNASLVAQRLKHLSAMQETWVRSLGWEDPLQKEMATHSRILAWRIPWKEEPSGLQSMGSQRVRHD